MRSIWYIGHAAATDPCRGGQPDSDAWFTIRLPPDVASRQMLKSVLLYLQGAKQAAPLVDFGVTLARQADARVRGLTLVDTRGAEEAEGCESAAYLSMANCQRAVTETIHQGARAELSRACLEAQLNFDVRRASGDPLEILSAESRFHDLVIVSLERLDARLGPGTTQPALSLADMSRLLERGVQPMLVMPRRWHAIERVLLVYDGSAASGRAIRCYLNLGVFRNAEHRLLAIGRNDGQARASLAEMAEYCASHCASIETGYATGSVRRVLKSYAGKWEADMLVMGAGCGRGWMQRLAGRPSLDLAKSLPCALFVHT